MHKNLACNIMKGAVRKWLYFIHIFMLSYIFNVHISYVYIFNRTVNICKTPLVILMINVAAQREYLGTLELWPGPPCVISVVIYGQVKSYKHILAKGSVKQVFIAASITIKFMTLASLLRNKPIRAGHLTLGLCDKHSGCLAVSSSNIS